ncbi:hypothetical protein M0802_011473 [Mischocyttarus mexicanus]|nr:hypothetical protein M0802_011473 [Mischocyttarus mexicanus]
MENLNKYSKSLVEEEKGLADLTLLTLFNATSFVNYEEEEEEEEEGEEEEEEEGEEEEEEEVKRREE